MPLQEAIPLILMLIALEGILSADNAMVLAILVRPLPEQLRKKALLYGILGAYALRGVALAFAKVIMHFWWIQLLGAFYLLFLPIKHFFLSKNHEPVAPVSAGAVTASTFWKTVAMVELTDLAFAVDSVLVAVALGREPWVIYTGVFLGILLLRLAAGVFVGLLDRFPRFEHVAYIMVGWAGIKLLIEGWAHCMDEIGNPEYALHLEPAAFWVITITLLVGGTIWALSSRKKKSKAEPLSLDDETELVVEADNEVAETAQGEKGEK